MYVPPLFAVESRAWALELAASYPFGLLVTCDDDGTPRASHLPMLLEADGGDGLRVAGHVAKANPQAAQILAGAKATAIFEGPHAYVSPRWYAEPYHNVPTWDYVAVHAEGRLVEAESRPVLDRLVAAFETGPDPWRFARVDAGYAEKQLRGIVAFELPVERLIPAAKMSQNRTQEDRDRVREALSRSESPEDRACAKLM